jgi:DNA-binding GntR family transcriptional regulator
VNSFAKGLDLKLDYAQLSYRIYQLLRAKIIALEIPGGQRLDVNGIAAELGVSRTSVKAAVDRLALEGLVEIRPRYGTFVTQLSAESVRETQAARLMIELFAVETGLETITKGELAYLTSLVEEMLSLGRRGEMQDAEWQTFLAADSAFHVALVRLARNSRIDAMYATLNLLVQMTREYYAIANPVNSLSTAQEHQEILEAISRHDVGAAKSRLKSHIEEITQIIGSSLDEGSVIRAVNP